MDKKVKEGFKGGNKVKSSIDKIKKEVVRNSQVPLRETAVKTVNLGLDLPKDGQINLCEQVQSKSNLSAKTGGSNTQLRSARKSKEKSGSTEKVQDEVKKVNIPFNEKKFHGLVDLGSLEAALAESSAESSSANTNKRRACLPNRDPEPVLSDYYVPKFDTEYVFTFPPAPIKATKEWSYNPRGIVDVLEEIESENLRCSNGS